MHNLIERARPVRLVIFDVDGVLTDGHLNYSSHPNAPEKEQDKIFYAPDGLGMKLLMQGGLEIGIITARSSLAVTRRMADLGVAHVYQGHLDKLEAYEMLIEKLALSHEQVAYLGDDIIDLPVLRRVGLAATVSNASVFMQSHCHFVSAHAGGRGAAREFSELILSAQGRWDGLLAQYLR
jgi:3-deoxy-D-manno-octulosonate 8-phosphate phosphatase (KDO 8-P phosphatase)